SLLEGGVDLFLGDLTAELDDEVGDGTGRDRDAHGDAVQLALELREHQGGGLGGTGGGRDDVLGGGTRAAQVLVREVQDAVVVRVCVHRGHQTLDDAEVLVEDLRHRRHTVGGAGGVGDDVVVGRVVLVLIDTHHDGDVLVGGRSRDEDLLGATGEVLL